MTSNSEPSTTRPTSSVAESSMRRSPTPTGACGRHSVTTRFPTWVPADVAKTAKTLRENEALAVLAPFVP
jgi:hypothetical protein